jgi:hypothetical protein
MWYNRIETHMLGFGMLNSTGNPNLYYKLTGTTIVLLLLYIDDLLLTRNNATTIQTLQLQLAHGFTITYLGHITCYLGIQFHYTSQGLLLHQGDFSISILHLANMMDNLPTFVSMAEGTLIKHSMNAPPIDGRLYC